VRRRLYEILEKPVFLPSAHDAALVAAIQKLDGHIRLMISDRRAHPQARVDLLTKLLLARDSEGHGEGMTDEQVRDEANTLFVAGHETTANALSWAFYELARHPEMRARVQAEADAFRPEDASAYDPERLAYTTRVFKETLRLYPPVIILGRRSLEPFALGEKSFPRGVIVFANPYGIHYHPDVWPDPDRFDPDRFVPDQEAARHKGAWLPFGVGPRVCIGNGFALMEGPIVMATIMRAARVEIDPTRRIPPDAFATLRPKGGVPAVIRKS
jgi:cytochrome P450